MSIKDVRIDDLIEELLRLGFIDGAVTDHDRGLATELLVWMRNRS